MTLEIPLNVLDIYLDSENPRHDPIQSQDEIIQYLLKEEQVLNLAINMAKNGLNPLEKIGVIEDENGNYIVAEGNRRLCALHLLNDPKKVDGAQRSLFSKLAESTNLIPSQVDCILFEDQEEANVWMGVRHNGAQDGVGLRVWSADQKARHNSKNDKKDTNALALSIIDYAIQKGFISKEDSRNTLTTASRYLGNPFFRETIGVTSSRSDSKVIINIPCIEFNKVIARFMIDITESSKVTSRTNKEDWEQYARELISEGFAPVHRVDPHKLDECVLSNNSLDDKNQEINGSNDFKKSSNNDSFTENEGESKVSENSDSNNEIESTSISTASSAEYSKNPDTRRYIVPSDFRVKSSNRILLRIFKEMRSIEVDEHPLSVAMVTRIFLENIYKLFHESQINPKMKSKVHEIIEDLVKHIKKESGLSKTEKNALNYFGRISTDITNPLSPYSLGANAHGNDYPDGRRLKIAFDNLSPIISYMLTKLNEKK